MAGGLMTSPILSPHAPIAPVLPWGSHNSHNSPNIMGNFNNGSGQLLYNSGGNSGEFNGNKLYKNIGMDSTQQAKDQHDDAEKRATK
jgi:hypothetical protein